MQLIFVMRLTLKISTVNTFFLRHSVALARQHNCHKLSRFIGCVTPFWLDQFPAFVLAFGAGLVLSYSAASLGAR